MNLKFKYTLKDTPYNREVLKLTNDLLKQLEGAPLNKINLYYYIQELHRLNLKYNE